MDQFTRRLIGFAVQAGAVDGPAVCCMFNRAIAGTPALPRHLSSDHDPLFEFHRWKANLRILEVTEIKTVLHVPLLHPFIERLIGTLRRELLDQVPFWSASDLERSCCISGITTISIGSLLPRAVPGAYRCLTLNSPHTRRISCVRIRTLTHSTFRSTYSTPSGASTQVLYARITHS